MIEIMKEGKKLLHDTSIQVAMHCHNILGSMLMKLITTKMNFKTHSWIIQMTSLINSLTKVICNYCIVFSYSQCEQLEVFIMHYS